MVETPITFTDRERGHSKMSPAVAFEELWLVTWWSIRDRPWWRKGKKRQGGEDPRRTYRAAPEPGPERPGASGAESGS